MRVETRVVHFLRTVKFGFGTPNTEQKAWIKNYIMETDFDPTAQTDAKNFYDFAEANNAWYRMHVNDTVRRLDNYTSLLRQGEEIHESTFRHQR